MRNESYSKGQEDWAADGSWAAGLQLLILMSGMVLHLMLAALQM